MKEAILVFLNLPVLEKVDSSLLQQLALSLFPFLKDHAEDLVSILIDKHEFSAGVSLLASEVGDMVDSAEDSEAQHSFVEIANVHL